MNAATKLSTTMKQALRFATNGALSLQCKRNTRDALVRLGFARCSGALTPEGQIEHERLNNEALDFILANS
jgi:hypothetical protein